MRLLFLLCIGLLLSLNTIIAQTENTELTTAEASIDKEENTKKKKDKPLSQEELTQQVFAGIEAGDAEQIKPLLNALTYYRHNEKGETALTMAIKKQDMQLIQLLVQDAVINLKNKDGETPLTLAIKQKNPQIIDLVIQRAKAGLKNEAGEAPLFLAIDLSDDLFLLEKLVSKGADVNRKSNGITPLSLATERNELKTVAFLIKNSADPSQANDNGEIPLYIATQKGYDVIAGILLSNSNNATGDANWQTKIGETLLNMATELQHDQIVRMLIVNGADVNATDYMDNSALSIAVKKGNVVLVKVLVLNGADVNLKNMLGETPITIAAENGYTDIANLLAENGANPTIQSYKGIAATDYGYFETTLTNDLAPYENEMRRVKTVELQAEQVEPLQVETENDK